MVTAHNQPVAHPDASDRTAGRSALVVPIPEAEPLVSSWRADHDPSAAQGVPAHITVVYPFRPDGPALDAAVKELRSLFANIAPMRFTLAHVGAFPGVTWLAPEPAYPFRQLIEDLSRMFPDCQPYGGTFKNPIPHLTVIVRSQDNGDYHAVHDQFVLEADECLPIESEIREVLLLVQGPDSLWTTRDTFELTG